MDVNKNSKLLDALFALIEFSLFDGKTPDEECIRYVCENIYEIYKLAKIHDLSHVVAYALNKLGVSAIEESIKEKLKKQLLLVTLRYEQLKYELEALCAYLEKEKIYHIPLKGAVIRDLYREPWMRTSCDIDILVHNQDLEKAVKILTEDVGFEKKGKSAHDISLFSPGGVNVELHFALVEDDRINSADKVINDVWDYAYACEGYEYKMALKDEMLYFYHIAHMAKHFQIGGCGIKPFIDHKILNESVSFDSDKRSKLLEKGNLKKFEEEITHLCNVWLSDSKHTPISRQMENYVLCGGVYGSFENRAEVDQIRYGGKIRYLLYKIWLPFNMLKSMYPVLEKHKWLLPICEIRRWGRLVFKGELKRSKKELKIIGKKSNKEVSETHKMMSELGLDIK